jgi:hypothetical protein
MKPVVLTDLYKGDPGKLTPDQVRRLKGEVAKGCFRSSDQIRHWLHKAFAVAYSSSGVKDMLRRVGISRWLRVRVPSPSLKQDMDLRQIDLGNFQGRCRRMLLGSVLPSPRSVASPV